MGARAAWPRPGHHQPEVVAAVSEILDRRAALAHPAVTLTVTDSVALGIAALLRNETPSGRVLDRFCRTGRIDSAALIDAARVEQGYATPEAHAALHCLIGWVNGRVHRQTEPRSDEPS